MSHIEQLKKIAAELAGTSIHPISAERAKEIRTQFPGIPESYLDVLTEVGSGNFAEMGFSVYDGPIEAADIFDSTTALELKQYLFIGDDFAGWMVGFDTSESPWRLRQFDHNQVFPVSPNGPGDFAEFLCKELSCE